MTCERPQSPQPTAAIKRARPDSTHGSPMDQITSQSNATIKPLSEVSQDDTINPPKRPRYSSERPTSDLTVHNRHTLRGSDFYNPPYAAKKGEIDRYVPTGGSNNWLHDKYTAPSPKALGTSTGATTNIDQALPANLEVPRALPTPASAVVGPSSWGGSNPLGLRGSAADAFVRAQRLGVQYDPGAHIGIPRPCTVCGEILPSGGKLDKHMYASHGSFRGPGFFAAEGPFVWDR